MCHIHMSIRSKYYGIIFFNLKTFRAHPNTSSTTYFVEFIAIKPNYYNSRARPNRTKVVQNAICLRNYIKIVELVPKKGK